VRENSILAFSGLMTLIFIFYAYTYQPILYVKLVTEDYWGEWTTFAGFFIAFLFFGWLFIKSKPKAHGIWFLLLGLVSFFIAMEEISWGQRLLVLSPPAFFEARNFQGEITFHNIEGFWSNRWRNVQIAGTLFFLYGVVLPLAATFLKPVRKLCDRFYFPIPSPGLSPLFLGVFIFFIFRPLSVFQEVGEMYMGLAICLLGLERWLAFYRTEQLALAKYLVNWKAAAVFIPAALSALLAGFVLTPSFVAENFSADGVLGDHTLKLIAGFQNISIVFGSAFSFISFIILFKIRAKKNRRTKSAGGSLTNLLLARKGVVMSAFLLVVLFLGYGFMASFGFETGFKYMLNDFAAKHYYEKAMYAQAEEVFSYIEQHPKFSDGETRIYRGRNYLALNERERGQALLRSELAKARKEYEEKPDALAPILTMAKIYRLLAEETEAEALYRQAIAMEYSKLATEPGAAEERAIRMSLGDIYVETGDYAKAIVEFEKAYSLATNNLERRKSQIRIYHTQDKIKQ
jgi:hypothetical protein